MLDRALEIVFPRRCAGCGEGAWPFCSACRDALFPLRPPWCSRCGRPFPRPVDSCRDCPPGSVTSSRAPFAFRGPARSAIHRLKFSGWRGVGEALAAAMVAVDLPSVDAVTWVPLARRRLADRGFDQAHVLASGVARRLGSPCLGLLRRPVATGPQARLGGAERRVALEGAFRAGPRSPPAHVLLVDDVLTTGATAAACAEVLRAAGAREVHLLVAARSFHDAPVSRPPVTDPSRPAYTQPGPRSGLWLPGDLPR